jgi:hypothetical protein
MYGTVARLKIRSGMDSQLMEHMRQYDTELPAGGIASAVFKADSGDGTYWLAVVFDSEESYRANADTPEQSARYQEFRSLLETDPEWNDGEVVMRTVK